MSCHRRSLELADDLGARTVAFPLISIGSYRLTGRDAVSTAVETFAAADTHVEEIMLVAVGSTGYELLGEYLET